MRRFLGNFLILFAILGLAEESAWLEIVMGTLIAVGLDIRDEP